MKKLIGAAVLALSLVAVGCGGGQSDEERAAEAQANARERVTPTDCEPLVKEAADIPVSDDRWDTLRDCRVAGYDPIWEAYGIEARDEQYEEFAKTGAIPTTTAPRCGGQAYVEYRITGSARSVDITMETPGGTSQQSNVAVPLRTRTGENVWGCFSPGDFVYISAQNTDSSGSVECEIISDGRTIANVTSSGAYVIATCSGSA